MNKPKQYCDLTLWNSLPYAAGSVPSLEVTHWHVETLSSVYEDLISALFGLWPRSDCISDLLIRKSHEETTVNFL